jgi:hypothetical protein
VRSFDSAPDGAFAQDFACGLPLSRYAGSLTPANRLKFKSARPDHSNSVPLAKHRHYTLNQPIYLQTHSGPARKPNRFVLSRRLPHGMTGSTICDAIPGEQYTRWVAVT